MSFRAKGYRRFGHDDQVARWAAAARETAREVAYDPDMQRKWLRHGKTWFVGVDALPNDPSGFVGGVALAGEVIDFLSDEGLLPDAWHRAQLSITYPGYPGRDLTESEAAHHYRLARDAAHVDGLLPVGANRRRMLKEPHSVILGLPLTPAAPDASPLVVWEGSHRIMADAFATALGFRPLAEWPNVDLTDVYQSARRRVFEVCPRIELPALPGEATVVHRLTLHGVAPWTPGAEAGPEGRMIAYFRPELPDIADWPQL